MDQNVIVCKCPLCAKTYRQRVARGWIGARRRPRAYEHALLALCEENGQGRGKNAWAGLAWCAECSILKAPESLRETLLEWVQHGEEK